MATTSTILELMLLAQGESAVAPFTNWGDAANSNFEFLEDALGETADITVDSSDVSLTDAQHRALYISLSGTLTGNRSVATDDRKGFWFVHNGTSGSYTVTFKTASGAGVAVPQGGKAILVSDGTDIIQIVSTDPSGVSPETQAAIDSAVAASAAELKATAWWLAVTQ